MRQNVPTLAVLLLFCAPFPVCTEEPESTPGDTQHDTVTESVRETTELLLPNTSKNASGSSDDVDSSAVHSASRMLFENTEEAHPVPTSSIAPEQIVTRVNRQSDKSQMNSFNLPQTRPPLWRDYPYPKDTGLMSTPQNNPNLPIQAFQLKSPAQIATSSMPPSSNNPSLPTQSSELKSALNTIPFYVIRPPFLGMHSPSLVDVEVLPPEQINTEILKILESLGVGSDRIPLIFITAPDLQFGHTGQWPIQQIVRNEDETSKSSVNTFDIEQPPQSANDKNQQITGFTPQNRQFMTEESWYDDEAKKTNDKFNKRLLPMFPIGMGISRAPFDIPPQYFGDGFNPRITQQQRIEYPTSGLLSTAVRPLTPHSSQEKSSLEEQHIRNGTHYSQRRYPRPIENDMIPVLQDHLPLIEGSIERLVIPQADNKWGYTMPNISEVTPYQIYPLVTVTPRDQEPTGQPIMILPYPGQKLVFPLDSPRDSAPGGRIPPMYLKPDLVLPRYGMQGQAQFRLPQIFPQYNGNLIGYPQEVPKLDHPVQHTPMYHDSKISPEQQRFPSSIIPGKIEPSPQPTIEGFMITENPPFSLQKHFPPSNEINKPEDSHYTPQQLFPGLQPQYPTDSQARTNYLYQKPYHQYPVDNNEQSNQTRPNFIMKVGRLSVPRKPQGEPQEKTPQYSYAFDKEPHEFPIQSPTQYPLDNQMSSDLPNRPYVQHNLDDKQPPLQFKPEDSSQTEKSEMLENEFTSRYPHFQPQYPTDTPQQKYSDQAWLNPHDNHIERYPFIETGEPEHYKPQLSPDQKPQSLQYPTVGQIPTENMEQQYPQNLGTSPKLTYPSLPLYHSESPMPPSRYLDQPYSQYPIPKEYPQYPSDVQRQPYIPGMPDINSKIGKFVIPETSLKKTPEDNVEFLQQGSTGTLPQLSSEGYVPTDQPLPSLNTQVRGSIIPDMPLPNGKIDTSKKPQNVHQHEEFSATEVPVNTFDRKEFLSESDLQTIDQPPTMYTPVDGHRPSIQLAPDFTAQTGQFLIPKKPKYPQYYSTDSKQPENQPGIVQPKFPRGNEIPTDQIQQYTKYPLSDERGPLMPVRTDNVSGLDEINVRENLQQKPVPKYPQSPLTDRRSFPETEGYREISSKPMYPVEPYFRNRFPVDHKKQPQYYLPSGNEFSSITPKPEVTGQIEKFTFPEKLSQQRYPPYPLTNSAIYPGYPYNSELPQHLTPEPSGGLFPIQYPHNRQNYISSTTPSSDLSLQPEKFVITEKPQLRSGEKYLYPSRDNAQPTQFHPDHETRRPLYGPGEPDHPFDQNSQPPQGIRGEPLLRPRTDSFTPINIPKLSASPEYESQQRYPSSEIYSPVRAPGTIIKYPGQQLPDQYHPYSQYPTREHSEPGYLHHFEPKAEIKPEDNKPRDGTTLLPGYLQYPVSPDEAKTQQPFPSELVEPLTPKSIPNVRAEIEKDYKSEGVSKQIYPQHVTGYPGQRSQFSDREHRPYPQRFPLSDSLQPNTIRPQPDQNSILRPEFKADFEKVSPTQKPWLYNTGYPALVVDQPKQSEIDHTIRKPEFPIKSLESQYTQTMHGTTPHPLIREQQYPQGGIEKPQNQFYPSYAMPQEELVEGKTGDNKLLPDTVPSVFEPLGQQPSLPTKEQSLTSNQHEYPIIPFSQIPKEQNQYVYPQLYPDQTKHSQQPSEYNGNFLPSIHKNLQRDRPQQYQQDPQIHPNQYYPAQTRKGTYQPSMEPKFGKVDSIQPSSNSDGSLPQYKEGIPGKQIPLIPITVSKLVIPSKTEEISKQDIPVQSKIFHFPHDKSPHITNQYVDETNQYKEKPILHMPPGLRKQTEPIMGLHSSTDDLSPQQMFQGRFGTPSISPDSTSGHPDGGTPVYQPKPTSLESNADANLPYYAQQLPQVKPIASPDDQFKQLPFQTPLELSPRLSSRDGETPDTQFSPVITPEYKQPTPVTESDTYPPVTLVYQSPMTEKGEPIGKEELPKEPDSSSLNMLDFAATTIINDAELTDGAPRDSLEGEPDEKPDVSETIIPQPVPEYPDKYLTTTDQTLGTRESIAEENPTQIPSKLEPCVNGTLGEWVADGADSTRHMKSPCQPQAEPPRDRSQYIPKIPSTPNLYLAPESEPMGLESTPTPCIYPDGTIGGLSHLTDGLIRSSPSPLPPCPTESPPILPTPSQTPESQLTRILPVTKPTFFTDEDGQRFVNLRILKEPDTSGPTAVISSPEIVQTTIQPGIGVSPIEPKQEIPSDISTTPTLPTDRPHPMLKDIPISNVQVFDAQAIIKVIESCNCSNLKFLIPILKRPQSAIVLANYPSIANV